MPASFGRVIPVLGQNIGFPGTISRAGVPVIVSRQLLSAAPHTLAFGEAAVLVADATGGTFESIRDFIAASAGNVALVAKQFAGFAVREVRTSLTYPAGVTPGQQVGSYLQGQQCDVLEQGSIVVALASGSPQAGGQVYARLAANSGTAGTAVGDIEAAAETVSDVGSAASGTSVTLVTGAAGGVKVGQLVTGAGVADGTYVSAITTTSLTLSQAVTAALSSTPLVFANTVALPDVVFKTGYVDANGVAEVTMLRRRQP